MEGWTKKQLGDLYRIGSAKRVLKSQWKTEGVPFYRGREITKLAAQGFVDNELFVSEEHFAELSKLTGAPQVDDIVLTAIGTIGNSHVVRPTDRFYFKDASVLWMRRTAEVSSKFINYWLKSQYFFDQLDRGNGATVDTLTIQKLQSVTIELPPLPEQKRIVAILDEAFDGLDKAIANTEKNLANARELVERVIDRIFTTNNTSWISAKFGQCLKLSSGDGLTAKAMLPGSYAVYGGNGVAGHHNTYNLEGDHVIIGRVGALCGNARRITERIWLTDNAFRVVEKSYELDNGFLTHLLNFKKLRTFARQAAQPVISNSSLAELQLRFPKSRSEQVDLAAKIDAVSTEVDVLGNRLKEKTEKLRELKQSLLAQAFSGHLVLNEQITEAAE